MAKHRESKGSLKCDCIQNTATWIKMACCYDEIMALRNQSTILIVFDLYIDIKDDICTKKDLKKT